MNPTTTHGTPGLTASVVYQVDVDGVEDPREEKEEDEMRKGRRNRIFLLVGAVLVTVVVLIVVLIIAIPQDESNSQIKDRNFPYRCFESTLDIFTYQIEAPPEEIMDDSNPIIICPHTKIRIGRSNNPSVGDFSIVEGDHPLVAIRPNVTIQCGPDGKRSNNCVLEGGILQVSTMFEQYHPMYGTISATPSVDGLTIRGFTFGDVLRGSGQFGGISVAFSHPGRALMEDCVWYNFTATKRLLWVGQNGIMSVRNDYLAPNSVEMTLSNCLLENVVYEEQLITAYDQALRLENITLRNIRLTTLLPTGCTAHPRGCRSLLDCASTLDPQASLIPMSDRGVNHCSLTNVCVENAATTGAAPIVIGLNTVWSSSGTNVWYGPLEFNDTDSLPSTPVPFCALGVANFSNTTEFDCLNPPVFELASEDGCPL